MASFLQNWEERVENEVIWLKSQNQVDVVLLDAPFIPAASAKRIGIKSVLISNFTFDAIFDGINALEDDVERGHQSQAICKTLRRIYSNVDYLLRLPGAIPNPYFDSNTVESVDSNMSLFGSFERSVLDTADLVDMDSTSNSAELAHKIFPDGAEKYVPKPRVDTRIVNLPLVVRMARTPRDVFRASLGIPIDAKVVLITFGGHSVTTTSAGRSRADSPHRAPTPIPLPPLPPQLEKESISIELSGTSSTLSGSDTSIIITDTTHPNWERHEPTYSIETIVPPGWHTLIAVPGPKGDLLNDYIDVTPKDHISIAPADAFVPDLLQASDVVVGKCGYGTCAEVVAHGVPLVYVPRPAFVEEVGLINKLMKPFGMGIEMSQKDFYVGKWASSILAAYELKQKGPAMRIKMNGEKLAIDCVELIVNSGKLFTDTS